MVLAGRVPRSHDEDVAAFHGPQLAPSGTVEDAGADQRLQLATPKRRQAIPVAMMTALAATAELGEDLPQLVCAAIFMPDHVEQLETGLMILGPFGQEPADDEVEILLSIHGLVMW